MAISIYWAPMRQGKTFCVTDEVIEKLLEAKRQQFTNWPVVVRLQDGRVLSSKVWKPEYVTACIVDADIYLDEAYRDFDCHDPKKFESTGAHTFFATCGHNNNDINLIVQAPARIVLAAREICTGYLLVRKTAWPWPLWFVLATLNNLIPNRAKLPPNSPRPLYFTIYNFLTEKDMASMKPDAAWSIRRVWFNERTASAYNTHYFRNEEEAPLNGKPWAEELGLSGEKLKPVSTPKERIFQISRNCCEIARSQFVQVKSKIDLCWVQLVTAAFLYLP